MSETKWRKVLKSNETRPLFQTSHLPNIKQWGQAQTVGIFSVAKHSEIPEDNLPSQRPDPQSVCPHATWQTSVNTTTYHHLFTLRRWSVMGLSFIFVDLVSLWHIFRWKYTNWLTFVRKTKQKTNKLKHEKGGVHVNTVSAADE